MRHSVGISFSCWKKKKEKEMQGTKGQQILCWCNLVDHNTFTSKTCRRWHSPCAGGTWGGCRAGMCWIFYGRRTAENAKVIKKRIWKEGDAFKKRVLCLCILWVYTGTGWRDATQTRCRNQRVLSAWMTFKYADSPCRPLASSSSPNPKGSLLLIYPWFLDRHRLFW